MAEGVIEQTSERLETLSLPEIKIDKKELYYGSANPNIMQLSAAEESTIGEGLYLTSDKDAAINYAKVRSQGNKEATPCVYTAKVKNLRMADLQRLEAIKIFAKSLEQKLKEERKRTDLKWNQEGAIDKTLETIRTGSFQALKDFAWSHQDLVTQLLKAQGFDGLIAIEGGEGENGKDHDSYVVFDPSKVEIKSKEKVV